ncbi:unnamed protein product, partial [marine sediment metagenome]
DTLSFIVDDYYTDCTLGSSVIPISQEFNHITNAIPEHDISAPKDTIFTVEISSNLTDIPLDYCYIEPNEDVSIQWDGTTPHWNNLKTGSQYLACGDGTTKYDTIGMDTIDLEGKIVSKIQVKVQGRFSHPEAPGSETFHVWGNVDGMTSKSTTFPDWDAWKTLTWEGLNVNQTDLNDLEITVRGWSYAWAGVLWYQMDVLIFYHENPIKDVTVNDFEYQILGTNYKDTFNMTYDAMTN